MNPKTKLELTWIGKENRPKLERSDGAVYRLVTHQPLIQVEEAWVEEAERRFSSWQCGTRTGSRLRERSNRFARN